VDERGRKPNTNLGGRVIVVTLAQGHSEVVWVAWAGASYIRTTARAVARRETLHLAPSADERGGSPEKKKGPLELVITGERGEKYEEKNPCRLRSKTNSWKDSRM